MSNDVKGLKELIATLKKIPKELEKEMGDIVFANAQEIEAEAKRLAPVDTGKLRQGIKAIKTGKLTSVIKANATGLAPYSIYLEYGTKNMRKQPFLFPAFFKGKKQFTEDLEALLKSKFSKV